MEAGVWWRLPGTFVNLWSVLSPSKSSMSCFVYTWQDDQVAEDDLKLATLQWPFSNIFGKKYHLPLEFDHNFTMLRPYANTTKLHHISLPRILKSPWKTGNFPWLQATSCTSVTTHTPKSGFETLRAFPAFGPSSPGTGDLYNSKAAYESRKDKKRLSCRPEQPSELLTT